MEWVYKIKVVATTTVVAGGRRENLARDGNKVDRVLYVRGSALL
jgi:predicted methyltransferase MtxX (methanogen marker protein 4)